MRETLLKTTGLSALQTAILRNFNMVETKILAKTLECDTADILNYATLMGLEEKPFNDIWLKKGYLTIIRNNWHLLPTEQILTLLAWDIEKLNYTLKEEDFFDVKLGKKTACEKVVYTSPTKAEKVKLKKIKKIILELDLPIDHPFEFLTDIKLGKNNLNNKDGIRIVSSYNGSCGDSLIHDELPFSETLLSILASLNINGVWMPAILSELSPSTWDAKMSQGYEIRIKNLNRLIDLAGKYGIKVYLYLNEPRCQRDEFFKNGHENLRGTPNSENNGTYSLCTSVKEVQDFLVNSTMFLCQNAKNLGGIITITMSENDTNCYSRQINPKCPRCKERDKVDVVAEVNNLMMQGIKKANSDAKLMAWNWGQNEFFGFTHEENIRFIDKLDKDIILMCVSEDSLKYDIDGNEQYLLDYSISQQGPSEKSKLLWQYASKVGVKNIARIQINNSWELCTAPYIPVFPTYIQHMKKIHALGINDYMLCWTLGSFPGGALKLASYDFNQDGKTILQNFLSNEYGAENLVEITKAVNCFSDGFTSYPFCLNTLYYGAQNFSVSNPLYPEKTGMESTMIGFPFDDLQGWIKPYSLTSYLKKLETLIKKWKKGIAYLKNITITDSTKMLLDVSNVCYISFKSYYNQCLYIAIRDNLLPRPQNINLPNTKPNTNNTANNTKTTNTANAENNTLINTAANAENNTLINTAANTENNTLINTAANTENNTLINTAANTENNTLTNATTNTEKTIKIKKIVKSELTLTKQMINLMSTNPYIAFEASNHYLFTQKNLTEKIINLKTL